MESLLTPKEIDQVHLEVKRNPAVRNPGVISYGRTRISIITTSPKNGIVIIKGDTDTGFQHILDRHSYWSEKTFWKNDFESKIDIPSQFQKGLVPISDISEIADKICEKEYLNLEKNKRPNTFDMYSGFVSTKNLEDQVYNAILYKDTKILHTLFPNSGKFSRKKLIDYSRGYPVAKRYLVEDVLSIGVPYSRKNGEIIFSFQIQFDFKNSQEKGIIINHKLNKSADVYERPITSEMDLKRILEDIHWADLSDIESIIKKLDSP